MHHPTGSPADLTALSAQIRDLPTAVLHDHLDGGLRPSTVVELCSARGIEPPGTGAGTGSPQAVADWFAEAADSGSLPAYLSTFDRTLAVMQTAAELRRIAREFVEDMVADGVVYAETRWAPMLHTREGLTLDAAVQAVQDGLDDGVRAAREAGSLIVVGQILCYLRHLEPTDDLVDIAADRAASTSRAAASASGAPAAAGAAGVIGVDLAGPEAGHPAAPFRPVFERARALGVHVTIHAGEADGVASIADALDCGAERIGHGVRLLEDVEITDAGGESTDAGGKLAPGVRLGATAARVHHEGICLEVCPSSNLQTGAAPSIALHQVGPLHRHGFAIAISSDNRLMSRTSTTRELSLTSEAFGWTLEDLERITVTALESGFAPEPLRQALLEDVVRPAYARARAQGREQAQAQAQAQGRDQN